MIHWGAFHWNTVLVGAAKAFGAAAAPNATATAPPKAVAVCVAGASGCLVAPLVCLPVFIAPKWQRRAALAATSSSSSSSSASAIVVSLVRPLVSDDGGRAGEAQWQTSQLTWRPDASHLVGG